MLDHFALSSAIGVNHVKNSAALGYKSRVRWEMRDSHRDDVAGADRVRLFRFEAFAAFVMDETFDRHDAIVKIIVSLERNSGSILEPEVLGDRKNQADAIDALAETSPLMKKRSPYECTRTIDDIGSCDPPGTLSGLHSSALKMRPSRYLHLAIAG